MAGNEILTAVLVRLQGWSATGGRSTSSRVLNSFCISPVHLVYRCTELVMSHLYNLCTDVQNWLCITSTACVRKDISGYVSHILLVYRCTELVMSHLYSLCTGEQNMSHRTDYVSPVRPGVLLLMARVATHGDVEFGPHPGQARGGHTHQQRPPHLTSHYNLFKLELLNVLNLNM